MKSKNGLKRKSMLKNQDLAFVELQKQKVNNLSEYTIQFYKVSCRTFSKFVNLEELKVFNVTRDLIDDYILFLRDTGGKRMLL
ncbi:integrase/recombinase XerD [Desulforamulus aeronauticus DSM 10349]|uniref:Integrase/recombinase XerD n=1 Tax=Desulforamulus aeronauticus DSM 10349 TaxID=1121421 RepID=A0A1M6RAV3_9FIRM|nr:integrase/recombinase XerD [Desulforamulus aeronauticus DSM 10349]